MEQPGKYQQTTQETKINPLARAYTHWHTLRRFKVLIEEVMEQTELQSQNSESIPEENLLYMVAPISSEMEDFVCHLNHLIDEENEEEDEDE